MVSMNEALDIVLKAGIALQVEDNAYAVYDMHARDEGKLKIKMYGFEEEYYLFDRLYYPEEFNEDGYNYSGGDVCVSKQNGTITWIGPELLYTCYDWMANKTLIPIEKGVS